jgi:site-specific DNA-cytosine methylase
MQAVVSERLRALTTQQERLRQRKPKTQKEKAKQEKECQYLEQQVEALKLYQQFQVGDWVSDSLRVGQVVEMNLSPGGMPQVWVSWRSAVAIPEQPERLTVLKPPSFAVGDKPQLPQDAPTIASLFTGGGLFEVGAIAAGFRPLWGIEFDPDNPDFSSQIADAYESNLVAHLIRKTVQEVAQGGFKHLERPTSLHVSQPCKSFSSANSLSEGETDLSAARAVQQAIQELQPAIVTIENVTSYRDSQSWQLIRQTLTNLGYGIFEAVVNAADYGVPQKRQRFLAHALLGQEPPEFPEKMASSLGWWEAIADLIPTLPESQLADWQAEAIQNSKFKIQKGKAYLIERTGARKERDLLVRAASEPSWTIKANIATDHKGANRHDPLNALLPDGKVVSLDARAIARLQSVPDWYELPEAIGVAVTLIGNGVPCLLAQKLMEALKPLCVRCEVLGENLTSNLMPQTSNLIVTVETVPVLENSELSAEEERERLILERKVERAFYEAGKALKELRDRRLYRSTHKTFEEYCGERFGFTRRRPYQLIDAAVIVDNLLTNEMCTIGTQIEKAAREITGTQTSPPEMCTIGTQTEESETGTTASQILPTSERQVRPLTQLEPAQQREVWQQAVTEAGGKVPSSRLVKDIVQRIRKRTRVPIPYRVGDVCSILVKDNPELRGKGGCWGIVTAVGELSCTVLLWDGEYQLKPEHLKELPYSPAQKEEARQISDRLSRLYYPDLEETAQAILASLGQIERPFLTPLEEELLAVLEARLRS